ncbi:peptidase M28 [Candidatus Magnetomorum sp. HK-1]|nr:peptidase M28 [Candidatus Magnetomorum sp. HK-1]
MYFNDTQIIERMESFFDRLWPINRSITGPGMRKSLDIIGEIFPTTRLKFNTGTRAFDWIVPPEWDVTDAYFIDPLNKKHAEFKKNNLHLIGYSAPMKKKVSLSELKKHIYTLPNLPNAIPYVTSYYNDNWGFCISHEELEQLPEGEYEVMIDTKFYNGHVEIGEAILPGNSKKEVLFSTYLCHPSMASNELSGPLVMAFLYECIKKIPNRRYTYRFVITSETIGTICYLSERGLHLKDNLIAGYVMTCLGDNGDFTYVVSRKENTLADRAAKIVLRDLGKHTILPFNPGDTGSDERQYCSPGFDLPVGSLMRTMYRLYPEYHTSLDNKDFICFKSMADSVKTYLKIAIALENNYYWNNTVKYCEPQLGRRGLYHDISFNTQETWQDRSAAMLWLLNLAEGRNDLLAIAEKSGHKIELLIKIISDLKNAGLLEKSNNE